MVVVDSESSVVGESDPESEVLVAVMVTEVELVVEASFASCGCL